VQAQLEAYNALNIGLFANCHSADIKIKNSQEGASDLLGKKA
jgi:hypothetical protein